MRNENANIVGKKDKGFDNPFQAYEESFFTDMEANHIKRFTNHKYKP